MTGKGKKERRERKEGKAGENKRYVTSRRNGSAFHGVVSELLTKGWAGGVERQDLKHR
jgi:hypothetical protein